MKKTLLLLIAFAVLGSLSAWYIMNKDTDSSRRTVADERAFGVKNTSDIGKIFIADRSGETVTLERNADHWIYNGEYKARKNAVNNLLDVIKRVEVNYVVARAAIDNIIKDLSSYGIKVEIYDRKGEKMKVYYVGGMTNDETGTYMIMEDANEPFVVHIPSWVGGLRARYELKGSEWRDKHIFEEDPDKIAEIAVEFPQQKSKSFRLKKDGSDYSISPFYEVTTPINKALKVGEARAYLIHLESMQAEAFQNAFEGRDSIMQQVPFCKVHIDYTNGEKKDASFYPIVKFDSEGQMVTNDRIVGSETAVERYHILLNQKDFMLGQHRVFRQVFRPYESFF